MDPQAPPSSPKTRVDNTLAVTQNGERVIFNIRRHPIGILGIYVSAGILLIAAAVLCFVVPQHLGTSSGGRSAEIGGLIFVVIALIVAVFLLVSTKVYWGNQWILTTDSITQVVQTSLFSRQSSQLSLGNLEDVTAEQNGVLTHMFNYGLVKVETASERGKFSFAYCPNPNYYAQQVLAAREAFEQIAAVDRPAAAQPLLTVPYPQDPLQPAGMPPAQPPAIPYPQPPATPGTAGMPSQPEPYRQPDDSQNINSQ